MTLYELANQTTIQGDVRVSRFDGEGHEIILLNAQSTDDLANDLPEEYEELTVKYIFNGEDGLHIEVSDES